MKEFMYEFPDNNSRLTRNNYFFKSGLRVSSQVYIKESPPFRYVEYIENIHYQGWKIHLSPTLDNYERVLRKAVRILEKNNIPFKYVPDIKSYLFLSNKNTSVSQFGKYITIYPSNKSQFSEIIELLYLKIECENGVQVPSDQQYKDSKFIYYRYGAIKPLYEISDFNERDYYIMNGYGEFNEDSRKGYYTLPLGISEPYENDPYLEDTVDEVEIIGESTGHYFTINKIIRHSVTGNVYEGYDKSANKQVIIKEGRLGGIPSFNEPLFRAQKARKNEYDFFKKYTGKFKVNTPNSIDYFHDGDSFFIIVEKLKGVSLKEFISEMPLFKPEATLQEKHNYVENIKNIFSDIFDFTRILHSHKLVINDISDDNFIVNSDNKVAIIDAEGISNEDKNEWAGIGTERFMYHMPEGISSKGKDLYMLSQLILSSVIGNNKGYYFDKDYYEKEYKAISPNLPQGIMDIYTAGILLSEYALNENKIEDFNIEFKDALFNPNGINKITFNTDYNVKDTLVKVSNIQAVLSQYYSNIFADNPNNIFKFRSTNYNNNNLSLAYGLPGIALSLYENSIIDNNQLLDVAKIIQNFALKRENYVNLDNGLIFGKSGLSLFLYQSGVSMESNYFFSDLVKRINSNNYKNKDLASGLSGDYLALNLMSNNNDYPNLETLLNNMRKFIESFVTPISNFQGLEYGNIGVTYSLLMDDRKNYNWLNYYNILLKDLETVEGDKLFTGLSYSIDEWPNIRSPYLYSGGAGLILTLTHHYHKTGNCDWKRMKSLLKSIEIPFSYNYGIAYGNAGLALTTMGVLLLPNIPDDLQVELETLLLNQINYIITHFRNDKSEIGFLGDKKSFYSDDFGNGGLGILKVLNMFKKYNQGELEWDSHKFSSLPLLSKF